ncbi:MAG TPA: thiamine pyrophosphate-binding protein, partial [Candidatus Limnocylindrales bacterium]
MTMTKGGSAKPPGPGAPAAAGPPTKARPRRSHVPAAGTDHAAAIEKAQREMLHEGTSAQSVPADPHDAHAAHGASARKARARIGADVVCEALIRQGVGVFFSYPGGVILPLYDVLGDYPELRHILVRHEQGGAHAADG